MGELTNPVSLWLLTVLLASLAVHLVSLKLIRSGYDGVERWYMPTEVGRARLVMTDQLLVSTRGVSMEARIADLFQRADGALVLVESRTRAVPRAYPSDVAYLSAVAYVLRHSDHALIATAPVASHAWIRIINSQYRQPRYVKVNLLNSSAVEALAARAELLRDQPALARPTMTRALCSSCKMKSKCPHQGAPTEPKNPPRSGGGFPTGTGQSDQYSGHHTHQGTGTIQ